VEEKMAKRILLLAAAALLLSSYAGVASAQTAYQINYYSNAPSTPDGTVRIINPSGGNLCALIYVTDKDQELRECCGCTLSDRGTRILSVNTDLTLNPANGVPSSDGSVAIVSSASTNCDGKAPKPTPELAAFETHPQAGGLLTEDEFTPEPLSIAEIQHLAGQCAAIQLVGSGTGVCTCGIGD
jgi:hypothetical protein